jgi:hypothetical protein
MIKNPRKWIVDCCGLLAVASLLVTGCGRQEPAETTLPAAPAQPAETPAAVVDDAAAQVETATETVTKTIAAAKDEFDRLLQAFEGADAATLANVQKAVSAVRGGNYANALPLLQQVAGTTNLTSDQSNILQTVIDTVTKKMAESAVDQAVADPAKAISDVKKSLPFGK